MQDYMEAWARQDPVAPTTDERDTAPKRYLDRVDSAAPDIECWHAFWAAHGTQAIKHAIMFNIHKYNWRLGKKDLEAQEVRKMIDYLNMYREVLEAELIAKEFPSS